MPSRADSSGNWLLGTNAAKAEPEEAKDVINESLQFSSSLSSTENLDMPSRADSSGNWLLGTNAAKAEPEETKDEIN